MILYFSSTGNSEYVAKKIAMGTGDDILNLFDRIKANDFSKIGLKKDDKRYVIVCPTYAWQIPAFFSLYLSKTEFESGKDVYFIMTCGGDIGNAGKYNAKLAQKMQLNYMGSVEVLMPDNYIYAYKMSDEKKSIEIIKKADEKIAEIIESIKDGNVFAENFSKSGAAKSGIVNKAFNGMNKTVVKNYYADDKCIGCGLCEKLCVLNNITLVDKKPVWGANCSQCYACIHKCPSKAINIRGKTEGKDRYVCPIKL